MAVVNLDASSASSALAASDDGISVWHQFDGFMPDPSAPFSNEFWRLSRHMGWDEFDRRLHRIEIFNNDFEDHYGGDTGDPDTWQKLCSVCSIDPIPDTIPGCMEVRPACRQTCTHDDI
jgi:hypothetical protein